MDNFEMIRSAMERSTGTAFLKVEERNNWQRAEASDYQKEHGSVPTEAEFAKYVTEKYPLDTVAEEPGTALVIRIDGGVQETTFPAYKKLWLDQIASINLLPETDQEFADLESFVRECRVAEKGAKEALDDALSGTADVADLFNGVRALIKTLNTTRLAGEKAIKSRKADIKAGIILAAENRLRAFCEGIRKEHPQIGGAILCHGTAPLTAAAKGKKTRETMQAAVDAAAADLKDEATRLAELYCKNLDLINACKYQMIFPDRIELAQKDTGLVESNIKERVAKYELEDERRKAAEAEQKRKDEELNRLKAAQAEEEAAKQPADTLKSFVDDVEAKNNPHAVRGWRKKHNERILASLTEEEILELDAVCKWLILDLEGSPPPPEEPPAEYQEEPENYKLQITFTAYSTKLQALELAQRISDMIEESPHVADEPELKRLASG